MTSGDDTSTNRREKPSSRARVVTYPRRQWRAANEDETRGLAVVENAVNIARSAEDVFDYCPDLTREPEWNPKAKRVDKLTDGPVGLGTRYEAEFLKANPTMIEFVRFERPVAWESVGRSRRLDATSEGRVTTTEDGARLVIRMGLRAKGTLRLLLPILGRFMHKQEERNLAAIKQALEGSGARAARRRA